MDDLITIQWYDEHKMQAVMAYCPKTIHSFIMSLESNKHVRQWNIKDDIDLSFYQVKMWNKLVLSENDWNYSL